MHTAQIINFRQALNARMEDIRRRQYTQVADKIAVRPSLWFGGAFIGLGLFWYGVFTAWSWMAAL